MKIVPSLFVLASLAACVPPAPVVSDYNGASVKVADYFPGATPESMAEAERVCKAGGKRRAEYASSMQDLQTYQYFHLFLCL
jgi:hypothetical protein